MTPRITAFYAALAAILVIALAASVIARRYAVRVGLGDNGDHVLARRIRAHANAVEYLPLALILLLVLELLAIGPPWLHTFGITLVLGRTLHALGLSRSSGPGVLRFSGMVLTLLAMLAMSAVLLWQSLAWWLLGSA